MKSLVTLNQISNCNLQRIVLFYFVKSTVCNDLPSCLHEEHDEVCPQNDPYNQLFFLFSSKSKILQPSPRTSTTEFNVKSPLRRTCQIHLRIYFYLEHHTTAKAIIAESHKPVNCMNFIVTALDSFRVFITVRYPTACPNIYEHMHRYITKGVCVGRGATFKIGKRIFKKN
jgi:hypothetical protein